VGRIESQPPERPFREVIHPQITQITQIPVRNAALSVLFDLDQCISVKSGVPAIRQFMNLRNLWIAS